MVSVAESMQEQLTAQKTGKGNKEYLRTVDVLAVATTQITEGDGRKRERGKGQKKRERGEDKEGEQEE